MLQDFLKQYTEQKTDAVLEKTIEAYKKDKQRRDEELLAFLDEFVNSEEYEQYLTHKKKIKKQNMAVQYSLKDLEMNEPLIEDKYPFTAQTRKMFVFKRCFDKYIANKNNSEVVKRQEKGIKIVKDKIEEFKKLYELTKDKARRRREKRENEILDEFCRAANVDPTTLCLRSKNKIKDKVVCYQKIINSRHLKVKNNIMNILRKLTREYKTKKQIEQQNKNKRVNKAIPHKVQREESMETVEIDGEIIFTTEQETETEIEEITKEPLIVEEEPPKTNKKQKENKKKESQPKKSAKKEKGSTVKKEKGSTVKKAKKEKPVKKDKTKGNELVLPTIPQCNFRKRLSPENYEKLLDTLKNFEDMEDLLENQYLSARKYTHEQIVYNSRNFCCEPPALVFKNFYCGKKYKKRLKITNTSTQIHKLQILETVFTDPYDALFFKMEPLFGIQTLATGCFSQLNITFTPEEACKHIQGRILFAGYNRMSSEYQKFFVEIQCIPSYSDLKIYPDHVKFGKIPIWRVHNVNCKTIKLKNNNIKPCIAVIKKVPDLLQDDIYENGDVSDILEECLNNIFANFTFEHYHVNIPEFHERELNIKFKNVDHLGYYYEKYTIDIYETCKNVVTELRGCQELCVSAETTEYFIKVSPDVLDFSVCILNSIYQLSCDIHNNSSVTQTICLKFPSNMSDYIKTDVSNLYIPPFSKRSVLLKFLPRKGTLTYSTYYNEALSILEFPVYFCIPSKIYPDIPPMKSTIFALLSTQNDISIVPVEKRLEKCYLESNSIHLGDCSIFESVRADIKLTNNTLAPQIYGFTNIPQCLTITPNYGFGEIMPNETRVLKLHFNPDLVDVLDSFMTEGNELENIVRFKLNLETVSFLGQSKFDINYKRLKKTAELMIKELRSSGIPDLIRDMEICAYYLKIYWFSEDLGEESSFRENYSSSTSSVCEKSDKRKVDLWLTARIVMPFVEFSHQYVEFPDTSCGSYSTMQIELRAMNPESLFKKCKSQINYTASFKILGGSEEIKIEPTCGTLKKGESIKLTLIVKPNTPENIIVNTAKTLKYSEVYEQKRLEYEMKKQQHLKKGVKKDKKEKKGTKASKNKIEAEKENDAEITVSETELELDYLDFYPAEMYHWRNLKPYHITTNFTCTINYETEDIIKKPDKLYLKSICKVTKPDFIVNLKVQRMDFEEVVIGTRKSNPVVIQNIQHHLIQPAFSLLCPVGPFTLPFIKDVEIPPEHFLEIPITFQPKQEGEVEEYFEISSGRTILPLILRGVGVAPNIEITPKFTVYRLQTKKNGVAVCPIMIQNKNESEIIVKVEKLFELKGMIKNVVKNEEMPKERPEDDKGKKGKESVGKKTQSNKSEKEKKGKKIEMPKFSDELTENEQSSLGNFFIKKTGDFCYDTLNIEKNKVNVKPNSTRTINIGFGMPNVLLSKKQAEMKKLLEKEKSTKKSGKQQESKKSTKEGKAKILSENQIYHVAKYNIILDGTFLKDIILISAFTDE